MRANELAFPILTIYRGIVAAYASEKDFCATTSDAVKKRYFQELKIVAASGICFCCKSTRILRGIGPFFGFNIFLNRTVLVEIELEKTSERLSIDEVRNIVLGEFRNWHGWRTREDFDNLREKIVGAGNIRGILSHLLEK